MQPADFTALAPDVQLEVLYYEGEILANRYEGEFIFLLYSLHGFYVELRHDAYINQIQRVTAFRDTELLEPYLPYLSEM